MGPSRGSLCIVSTAMLCVVSVSPAQAQDVPYANYLVGERALGLGGAFVGLADDPSATFHNPAGLALLPQTSVSTSFWLVAWQRRTLDSGWQTEQGAADLDDGDISSPPLVVTAVARLGPRDARGLKHHGVGFAVIKPLRVDYRLAAVTSGAPDSLATIDVAHRDNARWYGLSYAYGPTRRSVSVGVTGFLAMRSLAHEEVEVHGENGVPQPSPAGFAIARHSLFSASIHHLVWRLGVAYSPSSRWRLGAMVQLPGIRLYGSADNRETTFDIDAANNTAVAHVEHSGLSAERPIPWEIRVGATVFPMRRALVTLDVAVHGGAGTRSDPVALVGAADIPEPRFLVMETHLNPSIRAALGGELMLGSRVPIRGGAFVYRSGHPDVPTRSDRISADDVHTVGGSLSFGVILSGGHELTFGAAGIRSFGTGSALDQSDPTNPVYVATSASETRVLLFMGGGRTAAKRLARTLAKKSEQWLLR